MRGAKLVRFQLLCTLDQYHQQMVAPFQARPGSDAFSVSYQRQNWEWEHNYARNQFETASKKLVDLELKKHRRQMARINRRSKLPPSSALCSPPCETSDLVVVEMAE